MTTLPMVSVSHRSIRRLILVTFLVLLPVSLRVPVSASVGAAGGPAQAAAETDALRAVVYGFPFPAGRAYQVTNDNHWVDGLHTETSADAWDFWSTEREIVAAADGWVVAVGTQHWWCYRTITLGERRTYELRFNGEGGVNYCDSNEYDDLDPGGVHRGNFVLLRHADGYYTSYWHLDERPSLVPGAPVAKGQLVGKMGNTGYALGSTGIHLHFQIDNSDGEDDAWWCELPPCPIAQNECPLPTCPLAKKEHLDHVPLSGGDDSRIGFAEFLDGEPLYKEKPCSQNNLRSEAWSPPKDFTFELPWNPDVPTDGQGFRPNKTLSAWNGARAVSYPSADPAGKYFQWSFRFIQGPGEVRTVASGKVLHINTGSDDEFRKWGWSGFGPNMIIVDHSEEKGLGNPLMLTVYGGLTAIDDKVSVGKPLIQTQKLGQADAFVFGFFEKAPDAGVCTGAANLSGIGQPVHPEALTGAWTDMFDAVSKQYDIEIPSDPVISRDQQSRGSPVLPESVPSVTSWQVAGLIDLACEKMRWPFQ